MWLWLLACVLCYSTRELVHLLRGVFFTKQKVFMTFVNNGIKLSCLSKAYLLGIYAEVLGWRRCLALIARKPNGLPLL